MTTVEATTETLPDADEKPAEDARLMEHAYDGIREYDNPLPGWWNAIFIGTIVFAGFYGLYYHVVEWGSTPDERYSAALTRWEAGREARDRADAASVSEKALADKVQDGNVLARGKQVFTEKCASCHGPEGAGLIGPNLTDGFQLHGSTRLDIYKTVRGGVPNTAMAAWGDQLPPADVMAAAAFVITLRGTNLRGKAQEGGPVGPFAQP